jgi:iron complex transport system ATP-binding protein
MTILIVEQNAHKTLRFADRAYILRQGQIVGQGSCQELLQDGPLGALFDTPLRVIEAHGYRQVLPAATAG